MVMPTGNLIGGNLVTPNQPSILTITEIAPNLIPVGRDQILAWALVQAFQLVSGTRDANGALISGTITWPDGVNGVFTADIFNVMFPGAIDAWHATYVAEDLAFTITQPAVTRDANGAVTVQPAITIS